MVSGLIASILLSLVIFGRQYTTQGLLNIAHFTASGRDPPLAVINLYSSSFEKVLGISDTKARNEYRTVINSQRDYPLAVPTEGYTGPQDYLYHADGHCGVDIWTTLDRNGILKGSCKGNPVYAACSGYVIRVYHPNEEIEIKCDILDERYNSIVPSLNIKILYSHLGDAITKTSYHNLRQGQHVSKGELIGYQGNVSSIVPKNRVTHLHFGIYELSRKGRPPLDPAIYTGIVTDTSFIKIGI
jgi:murein DD-endopeptidase MepM/ murein hydrolase activator NlpD